jgi:hypothetical protein
MNIKLKAMLYTLGVIGVLVVLGFLLSFHPIIGIGIIVAVWLTLLIRLVYLIVLDIVGE